jgi:hypothetical protein
MRAAVYTCITGGYDTIKAPAHADARIDYHLFTDDIDHPEPPWQVHRLDLPDVPAFHYNRFVKMHPHQFSELADYDITVYVDGSIRIVGDVFELVERCWRDQNLLFAYEHSLRKCVYEEARVCAIIGHASVFTIARQMRRYRSEGFPAQAGLFEANVLVRKVSPQVEKAMMVWWNEYHRGARRDQLSLTYASWRSGVPIVSLGPSDPRIAHRYFELTPHRTLRKPIQTLAWNCVNSVAMRMVPALARF